MAVLSSVKPVLVILILCKMCLLSEPASLADHPSASDTATSKNETADASKVVINFNLPDEVEPVRRANETVAGEHSGTKFHINQSETDSKSTKAAHETTEAPATSTTAPPDTTLNPQQLLIPPASVNASIAQISNNGVKHKQGQIIIR